jgi:hypothetical protein
MQDPGCGPAAGCASQQLQQQLPAFAAGEATASLGLSELPEGLALLEDVIDETHLLQVGCQASRLASPGVHASTSTLTSTACFVVMQRHLGACGCLSTHLMLQDAWPVETLAF